MRISRCLSLALAAVVCLPVYAAAQSSTVMTVVPAKGKKSKAASAQASPAPAAPAAQPQPSEPAAAQADPAPASTPSAAAAQEAQPATQETQPATQDATEPKAKEPKTDEPAAHTLKTLPVDMAPNPPSDDELKSSGMTWRGEYEADAEGQPLLGPDARPLPVLYNKKGKRVKAKLKLGKTHPLSIANGTLTVDGWTGKARLNYDIPDERGLIYLSAPEVGTVIVSQTAFPGSVEQKEAFRDNTLTVKAGDHELQLASDKPLLGKKPESAWVKFDPAFTQDPRYPVMGYGRAEAAPYEWPGAKPAKEGGVAEAPPLPASMQPKLATPVCISNCGKPAANAPVSAAVSAPATSEAQANPAPPASTVTTTVAPHSSK